MNFKEVDMIYNDYVKVMTNMHRKLQENFNSFVKILLNEKQREKYGLFPDNKQFVLPGLFAEDDLKFKDNSQVLMQEETKER